MFIHFPRDPSTFSEGDWRHSYVGFEGPVVPSEKVLGSLGFGDLGGLVRRSFVKRPPVKTRLLSDALSTIQWCILKGVWDTLSPTPSYVGVGTSPRRGCEA